MLLRASAEAGSSWGRSVQNLNTKPTYECLKLVIQPHHHGCLIMKRRAIADSQLLYLLVLPLSTILHECLSSRMKWL